MDVDEFKQILREVLNESKPTARSPARKKSTTKKTPTKKTIEFSKKLMVFASAMYAATWLVAVISWFRMQLLPDELMKYSTYAYGVALAVYGGKAAYENKPKIESLYEPNYYEERDGA